VNGAGTRSAVLAAALAARAAAAGCPAPYAAEQPTAASATHSV